MAAKRDQGLGSVLRALREAERQMESELDLVKRAIRELESTAPGGSTAGGSGRQLSAAGREAIARAARKRWAAYRAGKKKTTRKRAGRKKATSKKATRKKSTRKKSGSKRG